MPPFPRMHYDDAVKLLHEGHAKGALETRFEWGGDFGAPDETYLSANYDKPLMVHHYPAEVKAFYMARDPERNELALGVDVLAPEGYGEVIGGGERATSLEFLKEQIAAASNCRRKPSSGISTCAATAAFLTPALAWASSVAPPGCAASSTSEKRFHFRACCTASTVVACPRVGIRLRQSIRNHSNRLDGYSV